MRHCFGIWFGSVTNLRSVFFTLLNVHPGPQQLLGVFLDLVSHCKNSLKEVGYILPGELGVKSSMFQKQAKGGLGRLFVTL